MTKKNKRETKNSAKVNYSACALEVEARTLSEAVKIASKELKTTRESFEIKLIAEEEKGLFGMMGTRPAKIKIRIKNCGCLDNRRSAGYI